jgi:hypothetical protein
MDIIDGGVAVGAFHMPPPFQRREHHEQIRDARDFVPVEAYGRYHPIFLSRFV